MRHSRGERIPQGMLATTAIALALATAGPNVDNPYFPLPVSRQWVYREGDQRVVVTVTDRTKLIANGVVARVVTDHVTRNHQPVEITEDYYAQDRRGTVWYLGEDTTEYEHGRPVSKEGLVRGRRRWRPSRDHHARPPEGRHALPPGVPQRPRGRTARRSSR